MVPLHCWMVMNPIGHILQEKLGDKLAQLEPNVVVMAEAAQDAQVVVQLANQHRFQILVLGSGSSFSDNTKIPDNVVALMMSKVDVPLQWDQENLTVTVSAGSKTADLYFALQSNDWEHRFLKNVSQTTVGGAVAGNITTGESVPGGNLRNLILGMTIINPNGQLIKWGGKSVKDVAGLDISSLMLGSGGVLGVIVDVTFRLIPYPSHLFDQHRRNPIRTQHYKIQTTPTKEILQGLYRKLDLNGIFYRITKSPTI